MGYLPAIVVGVVGLLAVVALVVVVLGHLRRTTRAVDALRGAVTAASVPLRSGAASVRERRAGRR